VPESLIWDFPMVISLTGILGKLRFFSEKKVGYMDFSYICTLLKREQYGNQKSF
jgi:hypothetical protein